MAETLKIFVRDLLAEFFAHALGFLRALSAAGAVAAGLLQAFLHRIHDLFVGVQCDFPILSPLLVKKSSGEIGGGFQVLRVGFALVHALELAAAVEFLAVHRYADLIGCGLYLLIS